MPRLAGVIRFATGKFENVFEAIEIVVIVPLVTNHVPVA